MNTRSNFPPTFYRVGLALSVLSMLAAARAVDANPTSLDVQPMRLELDAPTREAVLTLRNHGPEPVAVEGHAKEWLQVKGRSQFTETADLTFSPSIFIVEPGLEQVVTIRFRGPAHRSSEAAYRLFFKELSGSTDTAETEWGPTLTVPVFVVPDRPVRGLQWSMSRVGTQRFRVALSNTGNDHVRVRRVALKEGADERAFGTATALGYVLAGQERQWILQLDEPDTAELPATLVLAARTNRGPLVAEVRLNEP